MPTSDFDYRKGRRTFVNKITRSFIVRIALLLFVSFCFLTIIRLQFKNNDIKADIARKNEQIIEATDELEKQKRLDEKPFDEYAEEIARNEYGYRYPGEIVFYNDN